MPTALFVGLPRQWSNSMFPNATYRIHTNENSRYIPPTVQKFDVIVANYNNNDDALKNILKLRTRLYSIGEMYFKLEVPKVDEFVKKCVGDDDYAQLSGKTAQEKLETVLSLMLPNFDTVEDPDGGGVFFRTSNKLNGMKNVGGYSCYMDSIIFSLLAMKDKDNYFVDGPFLDKFPDAKEELKKLHAKIHSGDPSFTIEPFEQALRAARHTSGQLLDQEHQDDIEFLTLLLDDENFVDVNVKKTDYGVSTETTEKLSVVISPPSHKRTNNNIVMYPQSIHVDMDDLGNKFSLQRIISDVRHFLIFGVTRRTHDKSDNTSVTIPLYATQKDFEHGDKKYNIAAITIHEGAHYTAFVAIDDVWYKYDDTKTPAIVRTTWKIVEEKSKTHGSLFVYC